MSTPQLSPGAVIDDFTLGAAIRSRAGATTYAATDAHGQQVQVTVYDRTCFPSTLVLERSLRELRQLQKLESNRILPVVGVGKFGDGIYEATEIAPQFTLHETLQRTPVLSVSEAATLAVQIGEALLDAQLVGVMHRNLGADDVFPSPEGAKLRGFAVGEPQGQAAFGPLQTIAPEQVEGKVVDQRTLVYNLAALMHWMMSGRPLYDGAASDVLASHTQAPLPSGVHEALHRALSKDPRMRPMMLKQFLAELAVLGGVAMPAPKGVRIAGSTGQHAVMQGGQGGPVAPSTPAAGAQPTSRGWTMFMQEEAAAPGGSPSPAPAAPPAPAKPSTRGWTMFMQDEEAAGAPKPAMPDPQHQPPPVSGPPAPVGAPPGEVKPSTRGWTMFMQEEAAPASAPAQPAAAPAPVGAAPAGPAPAAPAPGEVKPSTRGWTMFMQEEAAQQPAPTPAPAPVQAPAPASAEAPQPSTRGWTMFMQEEKPTTPVAAAPAPAPADAPKPAAPAPTPTPAPAMTADSATPSSRGWTMFMEPAKPPAAAPAPPAPEPEPGAVQGQAPPEGSGPLNKKRGWTMFMDAPLPEVQAQAQSLPGPQTPKPLDGSSDKKGWTVFGPPIPGVQEAAAEAAAARTADKTMLAPSRAPVDRTVVAPSSAPVGGSANPTAVIDRRLAIPGGPTSPEAAGRTVVAGGPPLQRPAEPGTSSTVIAGGPPLQRPAEPGTSSTVIAGGPPLQRPEDLQTGGTPRVITSGVPSQPGATGSITGRTVFADSGPMPAVELAGRPGTDPNRSTVRDLPPPAYDTGRSQPMAMQPGREAPIAQSGGSKTMIFVIVGVVAVGAVVGAVLAFT